MKRVCIVTEIVAPYRIPVFNALAERGVVKPHVIFLAENDATQRQWRVERERIRFSYEVLPHWRWRVGGSLGGSMVLLNRGVARALRRTNPEALIVGGYNYLASWQAQFWARRNGIPFALWSESTLGDRRAARPVQEWLKRRFVARCEAFLVPGRSAAEFLHAYGAPDNCIFVAPNAVDNQRFARLAAEARSSPDRGLLRQRLGLPQRYFLYVGRLVREKGIFDLAKAYAAMSGDSRMRTGLVVVGDGPERETLRSATSELPTSEIVWSGFVQQEELPQYYALAEALVLPTWSDPWGLVVNEAMACGTPAIVSSVAGCAADLIVESEPGRTGWAIPPRDVDRLRDTMEQLVRNPQLAVEAGEVALRHIARYSPEECAKGFEQLVSRLTDSRALPQ